MELSRGGSRIFIGEGLHARGAQFRAGRAPFLAEGRRHLPEGRPKSSEGASGVQIAPSAQNKMSSCAFDGGTQ